MVKPVDLKTELAVSKPAGIIFDFDGTIADLIVDWEGLRKDLRVLAGAPVKRLGVNRLLLKIRAEHSTGEPFQKALRLVATYEQQHLDRAILHSDMVDLIVKLAGQGVRLALFSNNLRSTIDTLLKKFHLQDAFTTFVAKEDVDAYKPDPEGLNRIIREWSIPKNKVVFVGNDQNDTLCGARAGIRTFIIK